MSAQITSHLSALDSTVKHLSDITSYSSVNFERQVKNLSMRYAAVPETEEHVGFPCNKLPFQQNDKFFGRDAEIQKIYDHLTPKESVSELRTYTIYGRRGVGKTEIALQYAYENPSGFDAIFWIQCETSVTLRQSFTDVAVCLNLPGADRNGTSLKRKKNALLTVDKATTRRISWLYRNGSN
jgi:hypothetical protein